MRLGLLLLALTGIALGVWLLVGAGMTEPKAGEDTDSLLPGADDEGDGPALASKGQVRDEEPRLSGADVLEDLRALEGEALKEHLARLIPQTASVPIGYDEALARHLLTLLMSEDRVIQWRAQILLRDLRPHATDVVLPLLSDAQPAWRRLGLGIVGAWAREGYRLPADQWIALFDDVDKQVATYAWNLACSGVPYDEALVDDMLRRMRIGPRARWNGPERGIARMGPQGIERLLALLEQPDSPFVLNILTGVRSARPDELRPFMDRIEPWMRSEDEDERLVALQVLYAFQGDIAAWMPAMEAAWSDDSFTLRYELMQLWEGMEGRGSPAADLLLRAMKDDDERISSRAMNLLGLARVEPARVLPLLREALDDLGDDPAAIAIGCYGAAAEPYLRSALESPDDDVRYFALAGVYRMGPSSARLKDLVRPLVTVDDDDLAHRASMAMGAMGAEAADALPAIWERYVLGKMHAQQLAEILARVGAAGKAFLLARARDPKQRSLALSALREWQGDTGFAWEVVRSLLAAEKPDTRVEGLMILQRGLGPPPRDPNARRWDEEFTAAADVLRSIRERAAPLTSDPHPNVRMHAKETVRYVDEHEQRAAKQEPR